jgi:cytochrome c biogenesis factor
MFQVLGNGFTVLTAGARRLVVSVPVEMNRDHVALMEQAQAQVWCAACCLLFAVCCLLLAICCLLVHDACLAAFT